LARDRDRKLKHQSIVHPFTALGLGIATEGKQNCAAFVVLGDCDALRDVRDELNLSKHDCTPVERLRCGVVTTFVLVHITLGFKHNDIHDVPKNSKTIISRLGTTRKSSNNDDDDGGGDNGDASKQEDDDVDALATKLAKYL
jgi:hypothetical protein